MQYVLTLTAAPGHLPEEAVAFAQAALTGAGAEPGIPVELKAGTAADLPFDGIPTETALAAVRPALGELPVDANAQAADGRCKRLLIADMDSTIIIGESLDELAEFAGIRDEIAAVTERAMRGELDFEEALDARVGKLAGLAEDTLAQVIAGIRITPGAETLVRTMAANGAFCALVSGGFKPVTAAVRARLGFHEDRGNSLEIADGKLTGRVLRPILGREAKLQALRELTAAKGISPKDAVAVGDGANDLAMLDAAGIGVAFRAKPAVKEAARFRIDHADLTGLLYLQGYTETDLVAG